MDIGKNRKRIQNKLNARDLRIEREKEREEKFVLSLPGLTYCTPLAGTKRKLQICSFVVMARCGIERPTDMNTLNAVLQNRTKPKSIPLKKL